MKKKIRLYFYLIAGVSILLTAIFSTWLFYNLFREQVQRDLTATAQLLNYSDSSAGNAWGLHGKVEGIRVTLISPDGAVLMDTEADLSAMENHRERPEIAAALELGRGNAVRRSDTLAQDTFYHAVKLSDGNVLRLAKNTHSIFRIFAGVLSSVILVMVFVFGLCLVVSDALARRIMTPVEQMMELIDQPQPDPAYDELVPFARALRQKNENIRSQMERLDLQQQQIHLITDHMNEGLIILDRDGQVLSANASAVRLLGAGGGDYTGKSFRYLSRNEQLAQCMESAAQGVSKSQEIHLGGISIEIFASPVYNEDAITGIMCFLLDITERKRSEKMRSEFTANVSHELKTPLTSICGFAELLAGGGVKNSDVQEFGGRIHRESLRLLDLITDITKLSELDDVPETPEAADCKLLSLAKDCAEALRPAAEKQRVTLAVEGEECVIRANEAMLEQLIHNLLDNAIRYNKPGGGVTVTVQKQQGGKVSLTVQDTGIGIAKEHHNRIFERFYRVDKSRSKATGGTGLGLAIVKHAAEYHRAEIELVSGEDIGTVVTVVFPG